MNPWTTKDRTYHTFLLLKQLQPAAMGRRIAEARDEVGFTQQQLADLLGVHKRTIENWEAGAVPYKELHRLAPLLGKRVEWFLFDDPDDVTNEAADRLNNALGELRAAIDSIPKMVDAAVRTVLATPTPEAGELAEGAAEALEPHVREVFRERKRAAGE